MNTFRYMAAVIGVFLIGSTAAQSRDLDDAEKKLIQDQVTTDFKDPSAAQFRWVALRDTKPGVDSQLYCGLVNGKNSYGAYGGFTPFQVMLVTKNGTVVLAALVGVGSPGDSEETAVAQTCASNGLSLDAAK